MQNQNQKTKKVSYSSKLKNDTKFNLLAIAYGKKSSRENFNALHYLCQLSR